MSNLNVYKYKDDVDGRLAYIVAEDAMEAERYLREETVLPVKLQEFKPLSEVPKAPRRKGIWINKIIRF